MTNAPTPYDESWNAVLAGIMFPGLRKPRRRWGTSHEDAWFESAYEAPVEQPKFEARIIGETR